MAWLALLLVLAGIGYGFGVRSYLSWKRTGDTGLRLAVGPRFSASWWGKVLLLAALALTVLAPVLVLTGVTAPWSGHIGLALPGLALAAASIALVGAAQRAMGRSWRIGVDRSERTDLVTRGLFRYSRNPIFTGVFGFGLGLVLMIPTAASLAAFALIVAAIEIQVRAVEEPYLLAAHGDAYRHYAARTGRFFPRIGRLA